MARIQWGSTAGIKKKGEEFGRKKAWGRAAGRTEKKNHCRHRGSVVTEKENGGKKAEERGGTKLKKRGGGVK